PAHDDWNLTVRRGGPSLLDPVIEAGGHHEAIGQPARAKSPLEPGQQVARATAPRRRVDQHEMAAAAHERGLRPTQKVPAPACPAASGSMPRFANAQSSTALGV